VDSGEVVPQLGRARLCHTKPDFVGRYAVPELELEAQLLSGWVRFWFRGELVPLPAELLRRLSATEDQLAAAQAELARLREELAKAKGQG
jgi:hypothetical protein